MALGIIIAAVFIYLLVTNQSFMNYVMGAVHTSNTITSQLPISTGDVLQLLNATKSMNESQFMTWAQRGAGLANPVIDKVIAVTNSTSLMPALDKIWAQIQAFRSGAAVSQISSYINTIINGTRH